MAGPWKQLSASRQSAILGGLTCGGCYIPKTGHVDKAWIWSLEKHGESNMMDMLMSLERNHFSLPVGGTFQEYARMNLDMT